MSWNLNRTETGILSNYTKKRQLCFSKGNFSKRSNTITGSFLFGVSKKLFELILTFEKNFKNLSKF